MYGRIVAACTADAEVEVSEFFVQFGQHDLQFDPLVLGEMPARQRTRAVGAQAAQVFQHVYQPVGGDVDQIV